MIINTVERRDESNDKFKKACNDTLTAMSNATQETILKKCEEMKKEKLSTKEENLSIADGICQIALILISAFTNLLLIA